MKIHVSKPVVVLSKAERDGLGLDHFFDGTFGVIPGEKAQTIIGPNWPSSCVVQDWKHVTPATIRGAKGAYKCYQGGQVVVMGRAMYLLYHAESHPKGHKQFIAHLGIAVSKDGGRSFKDLGIYGTVNQQASIKDAAELCGGTPVMKRKYLYVYYTDYTSDGAQTLAVMRISKAHLQKGKIDQFKKYYNGRFQTPGLGGAYTPLYTGQLTWPCITYVSSLRRYLLVYSARTELRALFSKDGLLWEDDQLLCRNSPKQELFYPSLIGDTGQQNRCATSCQVYYTRSSHWPWGRWQDAVIERRILSFTG